MDNKIISEMLDSLRAASLDKGDALELALALLVWAKLSADKRLPEELRLEPSIVAQPNRALEVLTHLGNASGTEAPLHQAFSDIARLARLDAATLLPAITLVLRLSNTGVLDRVDARDAITALGTWAAAESMPPELADLLITLAAPAEGSPVYTPWDFGGQLAARAAEVGAEVYLETPLRSAIPALVSLLCRKPFEVHHADPIRAPSAVEEGRPRQFDVGVAFPPLGRRYDLSIVDRDWFERFPERTASGGVLTTRHLLSQVRHRAVVVATNSLLFSGGGELALRRDLLQKGYVQAVIGLPEGILLPATNLSLNILVLDARGGHQEVAFVDASSPRFHERLSKARVRISNIDALAALALGGRPSDHSVIVPVEEILANDAQLQVDRYVLPESARRLQAMLANAKTTPLGDLVTTVRSMPTTSEGVDSVEAREVAAADLPPFSFIDKPGRKVKVDAHTASKNKSQFLRPHDIVLIIKGSVGKVGIISPDAPPPGPGGWVAGQSAIVLRVKDGSDLDPRALALQLRSPLGQELLNGIVSGAAIPLIRLKELTRLPVLVPDLDSARRAAEVLEQEAQIQREIDRLREEQERLSADLWSLA